MSEAAAQLERVAQSDNVKDLVSGQADELRAVRARVVSDVGRAVSIVRDAGRGARAVATETYAKVARPTKAATKTTKAKSMKRAGRKSAVKAKAKTKRTVRPCWPLQGTSR